MNNKEKLYLIKLAAAVLPPVTTGGGQHAPGSIGATFQPNNVDYSGNSGPAIGSRAYRALPQEQRQGLINARDDQQAGGSLYNTMMSNINNHTNDTHDFASAPTSKGGLENIPARPAAHPLSETRPQDQYPVDGNAMVDNVQRQMAGMTPKVFR